MVYEVDQVGPDKSGVVIEGTGGILGSSPGGPAILGVENGGVGLVLEGGFHGTGFFEIVQVLQEEQPGGLLDIIQFGGTSGLFPEDIVYILKGLFEGHKSRELR